MKRVPLGGQGLEVSQQGLGCMGMSWAYGETDDAESTATIHRALDLGITFLDTSDMYGAGHNEELVGRVIKGRRDEVELATKFGILMNDGVREIHGEPEYVRQACDASLRRLGVDHIDLYYQHRLDPNVPVEETVGAMAELVAAGKVRYLGLSEVYSEDLDRAFGVHPITAVQNEYSLWTRDTESAVPNVRKLGVGLVAYSPLGRGFLTGTITQNDSLSGDDFRRTNPRFAPDALEANRRIADVVREVAEAKGVQPAQVALAWVHSRGADVVPIPGTKRRRWLEQNAGALDVTLTESDLAQLDPLATQVTGSRY